MNHAVIMAGGYGERFWPLSRKSRPKQCVAIHSDKPMIQETVDRLTDLFGSEIYISTGQEMADAVKKINSEMKFIVEPMARNTAACIGLSAVKLLSIDEDAVMFLETADHIYDDVKKYLGNIQIALDEAKKNDKIILIGIKPTHAHTGLGYIEMGDNISGNFYDVNCFKEKPDLKTAEEYVESGKYLWNSGMFIAKCSVMLDEIKKNMPEHYEALIKIKESGFDEKVLLEEFSKMEKISIDYGVMEKSTETSVLNADMHWDDIGDLAAYERFVEKNDDGNFCVPGSECVSEDSSGNIIVSSKDKMVSLVGVKDLIVAVTDDAVLVCDKNKAQDVKKIVAKLKESNNKKYVE